MATIRKRSGKYQMQVRRRGCAPISKTFPKLDDATAWARLTEVEADQIALPVDPRVLAKTTVGMILERYRDEIVAKAAVSTTPPERWPATPDSVASGWSPHAPSVRAQGLPSSRTVIRPWPDRPKDYGFHPDRSPGPRVPPARRRRRA